MEKGATDTPHHGSAPSVPITTNLSGAARKISVVCQKLER
jgi:hypothetical protein